MLGGFPIEYQIVRIEYLVVGAIFTNDVLEQRNRFVVERLFQFDIRLAFGDRNMRTVCRCSSSAS